jgi:hypothetical protein
VFAGCAAGVFRSNEYVGIQTYIRRGDGFGRGSGGNPRYVLGLRIYGKFTYQILSISYGFLIRKHDTSDNCLIHISTGRVKVYRISVIQAPTGIQAGKGTLGKAGAGPGLGAKKKDDAPPQVLHAVPTLQNTNTRGHEPFIPNDFFVSEKEKIDGMNYLREKFIANVILLASEWAC